MKHRCDTCELWRRHKDNTYGECAMGVTPHDNLKYESDTCDDWIEDDVDNDDHADEKGA
ncbi:unnamed protein product [marine sediment metagenome]|uniref:Uncharacterized protein n=1 Tax=marine sediment metagenome TaxID=412755 RepID=X0V8S8_9ZZZZ